jgi:alpha-beta hydrolase superfamily lysophospholipase
VSAEERRTESPELLIHTAAHFARRGYVVVLPLRRGFGATGGEFAEDAGSCRNPDYRRGESAASEDIMAAYEYTRTSPTWTARA